MVECCGWCSPHVLQVVNVLAQHARVARRHLHICIYLYIHTYIPTCRPDARPGTRLGRRDRYIYVCTQADGPADTRPPVYRHAHAVQAAAGRISVNWRTPGNWPARPGPHVRAGPDCRLPGEPPSRRASPPPSQPANWRAASRRSPPTAPPSPSPSPCLPLVPPLLSPLRRPPEAAPRRQSAAAFPTSLRSPRSQASCLCRRRPPPRLHAQAPAAVRRPPAMPTLGAPLPGGIGSPSTSGHWHHHHCGLAPTDPPSLSGLRPRAQRLAGPNPAGGERFCAGRPHMVGFPIQSGRSTLAPYMGRKGTWAFATRGGPPTGEPSPANWPTRRPPGRQVWSGGGGALAHARRSGGIHGQIGRYPGGGVSFFRPWESGWRGVGSRTACPCALGGAANWRVSQVDSDLCGLGWVVTSARRPAGPSTGESPRPTGEPGLPCPLAHRSRPARRSGRREERRRPANWRPERGVGDPRSKWPTSSRESVRAGRPARRVQPGPSRRRQLANRAGPSGDDPLTCTHRSGLESAATRQGSRGRAEGGRATRPPSVNPSAAARPTGHARPSAQVRRRPTPSTGDVRLPAGERAPSAAGEAARVRPFQQAIRPPPSARRCRAH